MENAISRKQALAIIAGRKYHTVAKRGAKLHVRIKIAGEKSNRTNDLFLNMQSGEFYTEAR